MAKILFTNGAQTALDGAITNSATSLVVLAITGFPASLAAGEFFYVAIEDELLKITAMGGTGNKTWTATRGADGTAGAAHATAAIVTNVLNKEAMDYLRDSIPTGGGGGGGSIYPITAPPLVAAWTLVNATAGTHAFDRSGTITLYSPAAGGDNKRVMVRTPPSAPWKAQAGFRSLIWHTSYNMCGVVVRNSTTGKLVFFGLEQGVFKAIRLNNPTSFDSYVYGAVESSGSYGELFYRVSTTSTTVAFGLGVSPEDADFQNVYTETISSFLGAVDGVGIITDANNSTYAVQASLIHWTVY